MNAEPTALPRARDIEELVEDLDLTPAQKDLLRSRYLDQTAWMSAKARQARRRYYALRVPTVVGSVVVPVLVSLGLGAACGLDSVTILTVIVSAGVGILVGLEELFHYG